ncbi:MAG: carboxypeptidase-like regulatory domain-containing protein [Bacteroidota bacterium]
MKKLILTPLLVILLCSVFAQTKHTLSGYVKDKSNGESLIGATVVIEELSSGTITNVYGFYSLTLDHGLYTISYRFVGYETITKKIDLNENLRLDIELAEEGQELAAVVITAEAEDQNVTDVEMSTAELDIKTISKIPAFFGEVDIVKSLQLLPGVSTVGEGASGFNVRGGSVGQNLILLDEAPVYNSSHLLGFFSVFNPDAVKDIKLYKGGIPAKYGGRLSSVLDVRMKEGNAKEFSGSAGVGNIFSRLAIEAPIIKDKASFILAGRRSYADILFMPFVEELRNGARLNFYDLTLKTNYTINQKNHIYLSGYFGRDVFLFDGQQGFTWGNKTATLRWNHLFNDKVFSNFTWLVSDYDYSLAFGENDEDKFEWDSRIFSYQFKPEFTYFINPHNELSFGGDMNFYRFKPANATGVSLGEVTDISLDEKQSLENAVFLDLKQDIGNRITLQYGLRFSNFNYMGGPDKFTYGDTIPGYKKPVLSVEETSEGDVIASYNNLEPRASFKLQLNQFSSVKASYNRMAQYIHLMSNTTASNPLDLWTPTTNNIKPQIGQQLALGYFRNFKDNEYETSVEVYYKRNQNQIDYIDGANLFFNETLEGEILSGDGRAYGLELYLKKNKGSFTGWISYTLGRSELRVDGIGHGWYPTRFDQLHNLTFATFYELNEKWSFSSNFSLISGTPFTSPNGRFEQQGYVFPITDLRNAGRIPYTNRLDLSATWNLRKVKKNGKPKKITDYWVFSFYNVYARKNPFTIYFRQAKEQQNPDTAIETEAVQVSIFATIIPGFSYNIKF